MTIKEEEAIIKFFNKESKRMQKKHEEEGLPESAIIQIEDIVKSGAKTAVDVGSGPGTVLVELLDRGVEQVVGIDLSPEMIALAEKNIKTKGYESKAKIIQGSFLDIDLDHYDAVSLHRVICCHPDREGMLAKAMKIDPEIITLTIPRDWKIIKLLVSAFNFLAKFGGWFQPFIHSQKSIDQQMFDAGYEIVNRNKGKVWVTTTYQKVTK